MLAGTLVTSHNLTFLQRLMAEARVAIAAGSFADFARAILARLPAANGTGPATGCPEAPRAS